MKTPRIISLKRPGGSYMHNIECKCGYREGGFFAKSAAYDAASEHMAECPLATEKRTSF